MDTASKPFKRNSPTSKIARALEKHADNSRPNHKIWGNASGNPAQKHEKAMKHFQEILDGPGKFKKVPV